MRTGCFFLETRASQKKPQKRATRENFCRLSTISANLPTHTAKNSYFLWPIGFQDGHDFAGYINNGDMFHLMSSMEACGVVTRFPHHSHLYRTLASKEWCSAMCMIPGMNCPLTTKLSRATILQQGPKNAAGKRILLFNHRAFRSGPSTAVRISPKFSPSHTSLYSTTAIAIDALNALNAARNHLFPALDGETRKTKVTKGVAKLGFSWEAMDVNHWDTPARLASGIEELIQQPGMLKLFGARAFEFVAFECLYVPRSDDDSLSTVLLLSGMMKVQTNSSLIALMIVPVALIAIHAMTDHHQIR